MLPKRDWMEMTWRDFANGEVGRWIAVLPLAAVEQHGPHLPLGTDTYIAQAYLDRVRPLLPPGLPVSFLPVQTIGQSQEHGAFSGTLTLSTDTSLNMLREIGASVRRAGVRKLVLITSHGGNWPVMQAAALELRVQHKMLAMTTAWERFGYPQGAFAPAEVTHGIHGGQIETAIMRAARPDLVRMEAAEEFRSAAAAMEAEFTQLRLSRPAGFGWMTQDLHPSGAVGNAGAATATQGEAALDHAARGFVQLLEEVDRFDLSRIEGEPGG